MKLGLLAFLFLVICAASILACRHYEEDSSSVESDEQKCRHHHHHHHHHRHHRGHRHHNCEKDDESESGSTDKCKCRHNNHDDSEASKEDKTYESNDDKGSAEDVQSTEEEDLDDTTDAQETEEVVSEETEEVASEETEDVVLEETEEVVSEETEEVASEETEDVVSEEPEDVVLEETEEVVSEETEEIASEETEEVVSEEPDVVLEETKEVVLEETEDIVSEETEEVVSDETEDVVSEEPEDVVLEETEKVVSEEIASEETEDVVLEKTEDVVSEETEEVVLEETEEVASEETENVVLEETEEVASEETENVVLEETEEIVSEELEEVVSEETEEVVSEELEVSKNSEEESQSIDSDDQDNDGEHISADSKCHNAADIAFVVDSSGSVGEDNFELIKEAIISTVKNMDIGRGPHQSRVGLVSFSLTAVKVFGYDDHTDLKSLEAAINNTVYLNSGTDIALGMGRAINDIIYEQGRPGIPQYMVVITDGEDESDVKHANYMSRILNTTVIAVGVGDNTDLAQLGAIAGRSVYDYKYNDFVFQANDFDAVTKALTKMCNKLGSDGDTCKNVVDVVFVVEPSQTVGKKNFEEIKQAINSIVQTLDVGQGKLQSRVGLVSVADVDNAVFGLDDHSTVESVQKAVNNVQYRPSDIGEATVEDAMLEAIDLYGQTQVRRAMIVFTDGEDTSDFSDAEEKVKDENIYLIFIAVGGEDAYNYLYDTLDLDSKVYNYNELNGHWNSLIPECDKDGSSHLVAQPGLLTPGVKPYEYKPLYPNY